MKPIPIEMNSLIKDVTLVVSIKQTRQFRIRIWLAMRLWVLGAKIAGCGFRVDESDE